MADATYFQNDSGAASRYLTVRNYGGSAFTYHSERFKTRATHTLLVLETPRANLVAGMKWLLGTWANVARRLYEATL